MNPSTGLDRLRRTADHERVQASGRRHRGRALVLVVAPGTVGVSRVGLTVSRRVGNAVCRNRVKRWLRESVRAVGAPVGGPWDLVLIARPEAAEAGFQALRAEVGSLFARVRA